MKFCQPCIIKGNPTMITYGGDGTSLFQSPIPVFMLKM